MGKRNKNKKNNGDKGKNKNLKSIRKPNKNKGNPDIKKKNSKFFNNLKKLLNKNTNIQNKQTNLNKVESKNEKSLKNNQTHANSNSLREKMKEKLKASRFRYLNEKMYTSRGTDAKKLFKNDPESFAAYHNGYKQQIERWPINPLDVIIESILNLSNLAKIVIGDFGCGDARLAETLQSKVQAVHSFDLVASSPNVIECDMANCPLPTASIDVAVYCLSLMGTNLQDYFIEANRLLKFGAILKIADVESRFVNIDKFIKQLSQYGFTLTWKDFSCNMFYFLDFRKDKNIKNKRVLPNVTLEPCLYKKR